MRFPPGSTREMSDTVLWSVQKCFFLVRMVARMCIQISERIVFSFTEWMKAFDNRPPYLTKL